MAKAKKQTHSNAYTFAAILLAVIGAVNLFLTYYLYNDITKTGSDTKVTMNTINSTNGELQSINQRVLTIIAGIGTKQSQAAVADSIEASFDSIEAKFNEFDQYEGLSDATVKRFHHARIFVEAYRKRLSTLRDQFNSQEGLGDVSMADVYTQDIAPFKTTASEMLLSAISINSADAARKNAQSAKVFVVTESLVATVFILGELAILVISKRAKKARLELEEREKNLQEVGAKLKSTRQKASDLAVTNLLTGMKNRYALDNDVSERLESDRFNIAVFDMDNFRIINDTYGYEFGDEYLAAVAEKLKSEFGDIAEIYNITGNEFCFLFNRDITESQAMTLVQNIQAIMSAPYTVLNLSVQLTVSGAMYHYLPGDCLNVNSLLVKLDTTMRNAKMNGGNMINTVVNI